MSGFLNISEFLNHSFWVLGKISQRITCSIYFLKIQKTKKNPKRTSGFVGRYLIFDFYFFENHEHYTS